MTGSKRDWSDVATQERVWKLIRRDKPLVIGLGPECTLFSQLQNLRKSEIPKDEMARAIACVEFSVDVANYQRKQGRYFYFEHPLTAKSWNLPKLRELMETSDVEDVVFHNVRLWPDIGG